MRQFSIGCAIWGYKDWVGSLFPPGSKSADFLALYSRRLTTVEGNTTFYAVPGLEVVARWAAETPEEFRFCFKIPREISHSGHLARKVGETLAFVERMAPLGPRLGPFFLQVPPSYDPSQIDDLDQWLAAWPPGYRVAVEVRHDDWYVASGEGDLMRLLQQHGAGRVLMDVRPLSAGPLPGAEENLQRARDNKPDVPLHPLRSSDVALVRYIGHPDPDLNTPLLEEWAVRVANWLAEDTQVFFFCHCPVEQRSPALCRAFHERLARLAEVPPLPWNSFDRGMEQRTLF
jgi:uncharacterized protein YecE (DUF72 family)